MNKTLIKLLLVLGLSLPVMAPAQTNTFTVTTLAAAITASVPGTNPVCFTVASATGIVGPSLTNGPFGGTQSTVGSFLFIDGEMDQVQSVGNTTVCAFRGVGGTRVTGHQKGALVLIGNADWYSQAASGVQPTGTCTLASIYAYPDVHPLDRTFWGCRADGIWGFAGPGLASNGAPVNRTVVAASTYTATYWDYYLAVTYTATGAVTVTLPAASAVPGKVYLIVDEGDDAGSHNITVTTANGCASITANYGACRVMSNGTAYFAF